VHQESTAFLREALKEPFYGKTVTVTHHVPTFQNFPEEYKNNTLHEGFVVECSSLINKAKIDYWVFGHHHSNIPEFSVGSTHLVTNQLGYVKRHENKDFKLDACFEV